MTTHYFIITNAVNLRTIWEGVGVPYKDDPGPKEITLKMFFAMDVLTKNLVEDDMGGGRGTLHNVFSNSPIAFLKSPSNSLAISLIVYLKFKNLAISIMA